MISQLAAADNGAVAGLIEAVVAAMVRAGIDQWDDQYPDETTISADLQSGAACGMYRDGRLVAYMAINENESSEYAAVDWQFRAGRPLVIHRLCVHPDFQGQGIARAMLSHAEDFARRQGNAAIRLDAFTRNPAALKLYEHNGCAKAGEVTFRKGRFNCYEKKLESINTPWSNK